MRISDWSSDVGSSDLHGVGGRMLDDLVRRTGAEAIEATVTPENAPSAALFRALGARHGTTVEETPAYEAPLIPAGPAAEVRFRIPAVRPAARRARTGGASTWCSWRWA